MKGAIHDKNAVSGMTLRNPPGPGQGRIRGFSLHELMVTLSLVAILAAVAVPSYRDAVEKRRITHGAERIEAFVGTIQSESIKRNRMVTVSYGSGGGGSWCIGAVLGQTPCDCMQTDPLDSGFCAIDAAAWVLRDTDVQAKNLISSVAGDGAYVFDPVRGMFLDSADSLVFGLQSGEAQFQMNLSVVNTGKIALCLPPLSDNIPGFKPCTEGS